MEERMDETVSLSRRDRRRLSTRAEILAAARELLLEVGPEGLSLRQVARRADFSPAALYTYFPSRDSLIASLFGGIVRASRRLSAPGPRRSLPRPPRGGTRPRLHGVRPRQPHGPALHAARPPPSICPPSSGKAWVWVPPGSSERRFRQGVQEGVFSQDGLCSAPEMAFGLWALVHGMVSVAGIDLSEVAEEVSADPRRVLETYVDLLMAPR